MTDQTPIDDTAGTAVVVAPATQPTPKPPLIGTHDLMPIVPRDLDEAWRYAEMVCKAGLAPDSYDNDPKKVVIGVLTSLELGVPPMQGLKGIAIINNRPSVWGDLAMALIQSKGVVANTEQNYTGEPNEDNFTAHYLIWRKGQENPYEGHFSIGDAKRAHLWMHPKKKPWTEYPTRMLLLRARAFALRDGFADCLAGLAIAEEIRDLPAPVAPIEDKSFLDDNAPETAPAEPEKAAAE